MKKLLSNCGILSSTGDEFNYIEKGYLAIDGKTISYIGTERPQGSFDLEKDMTGKMLIPGIVNAHTHSPMCLLRGVGSDLPLQSWLFDKVFPIEDRMTREDILAGSQLAILEMLACGTTSFTDMYMEPEATVETVARSGIKANICRPVQEFDSDEDPADNYRIRESLETFDKYQMSCDGRIRIDFCIHAEYTCTAPVAAHYARLCSEHGGNMHVHLSETKKEHQECVDKYGKTPAKWFADLGVFDSTAMAAHCVWVTDEDMEILRDKGVGVVHNPTSNMKLGSGFAPIQKMLDMGIKVALGTDGAASNNNLNMFEEMHLAAVIHNGYTGDPTIMKPETVLRMATVNGAYLQGREDTGELLVGKKADIAAIDLSSPHLFPLLDPLALICYSAQASDVCMTMVDGQILYEDGKFLTLDKDKIIADAAAAVKRLYG